MAKIVILDAHLIDSKDLNWDRFKAFGELEIYEYTRPQEIIERIGDADTVLVNETPLNRDVISTCPGIKYIGVMATGFNAVDTAAAKERGIPVTNVPDYSTVSVGQFAIALLLEVCHRIGYHNDAVYAGRWQTKPDFYFRDYPQIELAGKTMGIIGFGRIGQRTGAIAKALGMKVIAHGSKQTDAGKAIAEYVCGDRLFAESDVISLHCPLLPSTKGIINKETIAKMKDGVIIINSSRGLLIVEEDLAQALNSGKVYAAGLDVVSDEPICADNPLLKAKNCIITPHMAWASNESQKRLLEASFENLKAFTAGKPINVVN